MFYILEKENKYLGCFSNIDILKNNIEFLKNNNLLDEYNIIQMKFNYLGNNKIKLDKINIENHKNIDLIYLIEIDNELIGVYNRINIMRENADFFRKLNSEKTINTYTAHNNSFKIYLNKKKVEKLPEEELEKIKKEAEENANNRAEIRRQLNLLKMQKQRLEEKKNKFEYDLKLYYQFKEKFKKDNSFEIPELFKNKFKIFTECEKSDNLNFGYYLENCSEEFLSNSYEALFEGGNKLDNNIF